MKKRDKVKKLFGKICLVFLLLAATGLGSAAPGAVPTLTVIENPPASLPAATSAPAAAPLASYLYVANDVRGAVLMIELAAPARIWELKVGNGPSHIAVTPDHRKAYVSNSLDDTVSVIDTLNRTIVRTIPVGDNPRRLMASPDGRRVYVANYGPELDLSGMRDTVSVIDTATDTVIAIVPVGDTPTGIAFNPDGSKAYVTNLGGGITVIAVGSSTVSETLSFDGCANGVVLSPCGNKLYVPDMNDACVYVIQVIRPFYDLSGSRKIEVGAFPQGILRSPDGSRFFVTHDDNGPITSVIDPKTASVIGQIKGWASPDAAFSADGRKMYAVRCHQAVDVIDVAGNRVEATITTGSGLQGIALV
jgi:YVTN family beta-propeller protein